MADLRPHLIHCGHWRGTISNAERVVSTGRQEIKSGLTIMLAPAHFEKLVNWFVSGDEAGEAHAVVCVSPLSETRPGCTCYLGMCTEQSTEYNGTTKVVVGGPATAVSGCDKKSGGCDDKITDSGFTRSMKWERREQNM